MLMIGCFAQESKQTVQLTEKGEIILYEAWDNPSAEWFNQTGSASIMGKAHLTLMDGSVRDCSNLGIELLPVTNYAEERLGHIYAEKSHGSILVSERKPPIFSPDAPEYHDHARKTTCDENGIFSFEYLPAGEYYIIAFILWDEEQENGETELKGGGLMKRLYVKGGEKIAVDMHN